MYAALWRILPGPLWVRIVLVILLAAAVLYVLATWVFPWVETVLNNQQATVEDQ
jgi:membrane protein implicated in regulation of membrane protease activity